MLNNQLLAERLLRRRQGPVPGMRSMLIVCGGSMRGTYGAGMVTAFHQLGLGQVFDIVIGNSTGAPTTAYFLSGSKRTREAAAIYYDECPRVFLQLSRLRQPLDFNALGDIFRVGSKAIDFDKIQQSPSDFFVLATKQVNGQTDLINVKTARPNPLAAIMASIAIPSLAKPVQVNGRYYIDGDLNPLPAAMLIDTFEPTDVLIIPNLQDNKLRDWESRLTDVGFGLTTLRHRQRGILRNATRKSKHFAAGIKMFVDKPNINVGIIWPPARHRIGLFTKNSVALKSACYDSALEALKFFGRSDVRPDLY